MVPNTGKVEEDQELWCQEERSFPNYKPKSSNNITEGILVIDAVRSNT
jgi:hypothetical protein